MAEENKIPYSEFDLYGTLAKQYGRNRLEVKEACFQLMYSPERLVSDKPLITQMRGLLESLGWRKLREYDDA